MELTIEIRIIEEKASPKVISFIIFYTTEQKKPIEDTSLCDFSIS